MWSGRPALRADAVSYTHLGIVQYSNYGDWAGPVDGCMGGWEAFMALSAITPGIYMSTVFYYVNARLQMCIRDSSRT